MPQDLSLKSMLAPKQPQPSPATEFIPEPKPEGLTPQEIAAAQMIYQSVQKTPASQPIEPKQTKGWGSL